MLSSYPPVVESTTLIMSLILCESLPFEIMTLDRFERCDMAFIEPMHCNKPNITYLLDRFDVIAWCTGICICVMYSQVEGLFGGVLLWLYSVLLVFLIYLCRYRNLSTQHCCAQHGWWPSIAIHILSLDNLCICKSKQVVMNLSYAETFLDALNS